MLAWGAGGSERTKAATELLAVSLIRIDAISVPSKNDEAADPTVRVKLGGDGIVDWGGLVPVRGSIDQAKRPLTVCFFAIAASLAFLERLA